MLDTISRTPEQQKAWRRTVLLFGTLILLLFAFLFGMAIQSRKGKTIALSIMGTLYLLFIAYHLIQASDRVPFIVKYLIHTLPLLLLLGAISGVFGYTQLSCLFKEFCEIEDIGFWGIIIFIVCVVAFIQTIRTTFFSIKTTDSGLRVRRGLRQGSIPYTDLYAIILVDQHFLLLAGSKAEEENLRQTLKSGESLTRGLLYLKPKKLMDGLMAAGFSKQEEEGIITFRRKKNETSSKKDIHKPLRTNRNL